MKVEKGSLELDESGIENINFKEVFENLGFEYMGETDGAVYFNFRHGKVRLVDGRIKEDIKTTMGFNFRETDNLSLEEIKEKILDIAEEKVRQYNPFWEMDRSQFN